MQIILSCYCRCVPHNNGGRFSGTSFYKTQYRFPILLAPENFVASRNRSRNVVMGGMLSHQPAVFCQKRKLYQFRQYLLYPAPVIRRIYENQIKLLSLFVQQVHSCLRVMLQHLAVGFRTAFSDIAVCQLQGRPAVIHKLHEPGPAAPGFQPQVTAAGEQIQHRCVHDLTADNIEQGLFHPVRRRTHIIVLRHIQVQPPCLSRNNSHRVSGRAFLPVTARYSGNRRTCGPSFYTEHRRTLIFLFIIQQNCRFVTFQLLNIVTNL